YRIYAAFDGGTPEIIARTNATNMSLSLPSGNIELFVEALISNCAGTPVFTPHVKFTVTKATTCDAHRPVTLVAPIGGAQTNAKVGFKWTATDTAALYRVWVSMNGEPFESVGVTADTLERT